jgi:transposase
VWLEAAYKAQEKGVDWVEKVLGWSAEIVRHPHKLAPEEVMRIWARECAKEGVMVDWKKLLPHEGPRPFLPKRWIVERSLAWICHNRRMSKDYERLCASGEAFSYMLLWFALRWADWLALEDFSYSLTASVAISCTHPRGNFATDASKTR